VSDPAQAPALPPESQENVVFHEDEAVVDADALIAGLAGPPLSKTLTFSVLIHVVVVLITSVHFISLCVKHDTLDPRAAIQETREAERQRQIEAEREAARQRLLAGQAKRQAAAKGKAPAPPAKGEQPKVLRDLGATSPQRPKTPDVGLDELDLE
jgi:hypothetical protein